MQHRVLRLWVRAYAETSDPSERERDRVTMGGARAGGWLGVVIAVAMTACGGGGGEAESADDVVGCFEDAGLTDVEDGEVSDAEDIGALEEAAGEEADGFVSGLDSEDRDVFVLLYDSEEDAEEAQSDVAGEREVGLRDDKLLIYSAEIGPEDRTAIEECFIAE